MPNRQAREFDPENGNTHVQAGSLAATPGGKTVDHTSRVLLLLSVKDVFLANKVLDVCIAP